MKSKFYIPLFTLILLLLASCNKADLKQDVYMQNISFNGATKGSEGSNGEVWLNGDRVSIFTQSNQVKQFEFNQNSWQSVDGKQFYGEVPGTFFGVFPASSSSSFTIPTDQSTLEKLSSATYMSSNNVLLTDFMQPLNLVLNIG